MDGSDLPSPELRRLLDAAEAEIRALKLDLEMERSQTKIQAQEITLLTLALETERKRREADIAWQAARVATAQAKVAKFARGEV